MGGGWLNARGSTFSRAPAPVAIISDDCQWTRNGAGATRPRPRSPLGSRLTPRGVCSQRRCRQHATPRLADLENMVEARRAPARARLRDVLGREAELEEHLTTRLRPEAARAARTAAAKGALERRNHAIAFKNI